MSIRVEWALAADMLVEFAEAGEFKDGYGTTHDQPVLLLGDDTIFAIEGTPSEIRALLLKALDAVVG